MTRFFRTGVRQRSRPDRPASGRRRSGRILDTLLRDARAIRPQGQKRKDTPGPMRTSIPSPMRASIPCPCRARASIPRQCRTRAGGSHPGRLLGRILRTDSAERPVPFRSRSFRLRRERSKTAVCTACPGIPYVLLSDEQDAGAPPEEIPGATSSCILRYTTPSFLFTARACAITASGHPPGPSGPFPATKHPLSRRTRRKNRPPLPKKRGQIVDKAIFAKASPGPVHTTAPLTRVCGILWRTEMPFLPFSSLHNSVGKAEFFRLARSESFFKRGWTLLSCPS